MQMYSMPKTSVLNDGEDFELKFPHNVYDNIISTFVTDMFLVSRICISFF